MKIKFRAGVLMAAASALAIAVPAAAHPSASQHPDGTNHPNGSNHSSDLHRCKPHNVAYIVHGTIDASQGSAPSGMLEVDVTRTNHWAKKDETASGPVGYQLDPNTKVKFDGSTTGDFSAGERVTLIGKASVISNRHCPGAGTLGTPTFRLVVVHSATS